MRTHSRMSVQFGQGLPISTEGTRDPLLLAVHIGIPLIIASSDSTDARVSHISGALPIVPLAPGLMDEEIGGQDEIVAFWAQGVRLIFLGFHFWVLSLFYNGLLRE